MTPAVFRHPVFGPSGGQPALGGATIPLSMIDVVFLLLIFLLLGQFSLGEGLLAMPQAGPASPQADAPRTLWVRIAPRDGGVEYRLNDWPATASSAELIAAIRDWSRTRSPQSLAVVVDPAPGVPFEKLVEIWEACRQMGIEQLALPSQSPP